MCQPMSPQTLCLREMLRVIYEVLQTTVPSESIHRSGVKDRGHYENRYIAREIVLSSISS